MEPYPLTAEPEQLLSISKSGRGGRRPRAGRKPSALKGLLKVRPRGPKPSTVQGLLKKLRPRRAEAFKKEVRLFALRMLMNLANNPDMRKAVEKALSGLQADSATPLKPLLDTQPRQQPGRGGRRPGAGAKPTTIRGLLNRLPAKRANRLRKDLSTAVLAEVKAIVRKNLREKPRRKGRKPKDQMAARVAQLKTTGLSWGMLTNKMNLEARQSGQEEKTEDAYRSLYRSRQRKLAKPGRGGFRPGAGAKPGSKHLRPVVEIPASISTTPG